MKATGLAKVLEALGIDVPEDTGLDIELVEGCANLDWDGVVRVSSCGELLNGFSWVVNATGSSGNIFLSTADLWAGFDNTDKFKVVLSDLQAEGLGVRWLQRERSQPYQVMPSLFPFC